MNKTPLAIALAGMIGWAVSALGAVTGHVTFEPTELQGGLNYEAVRVTGRVTDVTGCASGSTLQLTVTATGSDGSVFEETIDHEVGTTDFACDISGLTAGIYYAIDARLSQGGTPATTYVEGAAHARMTETATWFDENYETYLGSRVGTGTWSGRETASVTDERIIINGGDIGTGLTFVPSDSLAAPHDGYECRTLARFAAPSVQMLDLENTIYGITLAAESDDSDEYYFAVLSNGTWQAVSRSVYAPDVDIDYAFTFVVNEKTGRLAYFVHAVSDSHEWQDVLLMTVDLDAMMVPVKFDYLGSGQLVTAAGDGYDSRLIEFSVDYDNVKPGTNFAAVASEMTVRLTALHETDRTNGFIRVYVRDAGGNVIATKDVSFSALGERDITVVVGGLEQGAYYSVSTQVFVGEDEQSGGSTELPMARTVDGWIDEDAYTFSDYDLGTGVWSDTNDVASVADDQIAFIRSDWDLSTTFEPTNNALAVRSSQAKDIHFVSTFTRPGFYWEDGYPGVESGVIASMTLACDDNYVTQLAVVSNDCWLLVPRSTFQPELNTEYDLVVRLDKKLTNLVYGVVSDDGLFQALMTVPMTNEISGVTLDFTGKGLIRHIQGTSLDAHLGQVGDEEFWTLDDAIAAAGTNKDLRPLWYSEYTVTDPSGMLRVVDPSSYLNLIFATWHHVQVLQGRKVRIYRWLSGNNWIEYADVAGVTEVPGGWVVNTAEGLAWIAAESTNHWVSGSVALGANIDLASKNWTPIRHFTGTFDGNGFTITGLNNTNVYADIGEAGVYPSGPVNDWGRSAYGLFATVSNATVRNVTFADVAISNEADVASVVLGIHADGDLTVSNVLVSSGYLLGMGEMVASIVGTAERWGDKLLVVDNENAVSVTAQAEAYEEPRWVAGIMTVAGDGTTAGTLVVTGNVNRGTLANTVYNNENGGNVAQVVVGTRWDAQFGTVVATNNVAAGEMDVYVVGHEGWTLGGDDWTADVLPVCNFAAAVTRLAQDGGYRRFVEANDPSAVVIDPATRRARMLADRFQNGATNVVGQWIDRITATPDGGSLTVPAGTALDAWDSILIDRNLIFDLGGNTLYAVYDVDAVTLSNKVTATVKNGTIVVGEGCEPFAGTLDNLTQENITVTRLDEDFWNRTTLSLDGEPMAVNEIGEYLVSGASIELYADSELSIDEKNGTLSLGGVRIASLPNYRSFARAPANDGATVIGSSAYVVNLNKNALPSGDVEITAPEEGAITLHVTGLQAGLYYAILHKDSIVEQWSEPAADDWVYVTSENSAVSFHAPAGNSSGFYTIRVTDQKPTE